jgi:hypothetical protein
VDAVTIATLLRIAVEAVRDGVARGELTEAQAAEMLEAAREGQHDAMGDWRDRLDAIGRGPASS